MAARDFPLGLPGFHYQDLHDELRLAELDRKFLEALDAEDAALASRLRAYRAQPASFDPLSRSRLLIDAARPLARFIARLFGIEKEWNAQKSAAGPEAVLFRLTRDFLTGRAAKAKLPENLEVNCRRSPGRRTRPASRIRSPAPMELATAEMGTGPDLKAIWRRARSPMPPGPAAGELACALPIRPRGFPKPSSDRTRGTFVSV
jgi:hypothetical protein